MQVSYSRGSLAVSPRGLPRRKCAAKRKGGKLVGGNMLNLIYGLSLCSSQLRHPQLPLPALSLVSQFQAPSLACKNRKVAAFAYEDG